MMLDHFANPAYKRDYATNIRDYYTNYQPGALKHASRREQAYEPLAPILIYLPNTDLRMRQNVCRNTRL
jgi:hypothetical protein